MENLFLGIFVFGLAFVVLSFLLGFAHLGLDLPGTDHLHTGGLHDTGAVDSHDTHVSPLNVGTVTAFLTWFGGIGYILESQGMLGGIALLGIAAIGGLFGAGIIFIVLAQYLIPRQSKAMNPSDYRMEGILARVTIPVSGDRIGEIIFTRDGTTRSEGARSADNSFLPRGSEVVILRYERGIAYVAPFDKLLAEHIQDETRLNDSRNGS